MPQRWLLGAVTVMGKPKIRHCYLCGEELGIYAEYDQFDTCGKTECERKARDDIAADRFEAHEKLDRDRGW